MANRCSTTITITVPTYHNFDINLDVKAYQEDFFNWISLFETTPPGTKFTFEKSGYEMRDVLELFCPYPNEQWSSPEELELFEKDPDVWRRRQWGVPFSYDVQVFADENMENRFHVVMETPEHPPTFAILNASRDHCRRLLAGMGTEGWLFSFESGNQYSERYHEGSCQNGSITGFVYDENVSVSFEDYYGKALIENFDLDQ